jgi:hypothetical protein
MSTRKQQISFYASEAVGAWYNSLPKGSGSIWLNKALESYIAGTTEDEDRIKALERRVQLLEARANA